MHPSQEGQAKRAATMAAKLFMDIALLAPKTAKPWIEAWPNGASTAEDTQALHGNIERWAVEILSSLIRVPAAIHSPTPGRAEMGGDGGEVVVDQRPLQQVPGLGVRGKVVDKASQRTRNDEHMTVHAQNELSTRLCEDAVAYRRA